MAHRPILIAGGGIGGLTTAIALHRRGHDCVIFEQAPEIRASGSGITLQTNAMIAMEEFSVADDLRAAGSTLRGGCIQSAQGKNIQRLELDVEPPGLALHRQRLLRILAEHNRAPVRFGARVDDYRQNDAGVEIVLDDGSSVAGRALIACDGLHSRVRQAMRGEEPLVYAGYTTWRGICRGLDSSTHETVERWGAGERFGIVPIGHEEIYWFAVAEAEAGGEDGPSPTTELLARFAGWGAPVEQLLRATRDEDVIRTDTFDRDPIDRWTDGRVALLGDAAHPMTPNLGQGAGQAIEDAVALADAVSARPSAIDVALTDYEERRLRRANWFVRQSRQMGRIAQFQNPIARGLRDLGMRLTPAPLVRRRVAEMYDPGFQ